MKKKNKINNRGDPYKIPIGIGISSLSYPLIIIFIKYSVRKAWMNLIIQSNKPLFFKIHRSLLYNTLLKAPLKFRLSINIVYPKWACHAA